MFSNESCKHAEACRFCWMCRHICPVGIATGNEAWTPRARGLLLSAAERGTAFDESVAEAMFKCSLCDACANDCATGYKPSLFIREARTYAVAEGLAAPAVMQAIENIMNTQNIYGDARNKELCSAVAALPEKAEVLLYLGQTAYARGSQTGFAVISLLKKAGVNFTVLKDEPASGGLLSELIGFTGEVQQQAARAAAAITATGAKTLVVLNPHDGCIFTEEYAKWNLLPGVKVLTATAFLAELAESGKLAVKTTGLKASFQDPCRLARGLGETEACRKLLKALSVELTEMFLSGKMSRCCGGPVMNAHSPDVVKRMVASRQADAQRLGAETIITACPDCQDIMTAHGDGKATYIDLFRLLDENC